MSIIEESYKTLTRAELEGLPDTLVQALQGVEQNLR